MLHLIWKDRFCILPLLSLFKNGNSEICPLIEVNKINRLSQSQDNLPFVYSYPPVLSVCPDVCQCSCRLQFSSLCCISGVKVSVLSGLKLSAVEALEWGMRRTRLLWYMKEQHYTEECPLCCNSQVLRCYSIHYYFSISEGSMQFWRTKRVLRGKSFQSSSNFSFKFITRSLLASRQWKMFGDSVLV